MDTTTMVAPTMTIHIARIHHLLITTPSLAIKNLNMKAGGRQREAHEEQS